MVWIVMLETGKTVTLDKFNVVAGNTVGFTLTFNELNITRTNWTLDFGPLKDFLVQYPNKTWKDYARAVLLMAYNDFKTAKDMVDNMTTEAAKV